ncbi:MAG: hypothetical protein H6670_19965 [Anaerolineaceae bacterium]|nr:hypothetical protein [Anaerolineaceae bacterium]
MNMTFLRNRFTVFALIAAIMFGSVGNTGAFLETIGDFLSLGANTVREIQEAITLASSEVANTLNTIDGTVRDLMDELEEKYQDNLNITIDSLDAATRNKLLEVESLMLSVNDILKDDVRFISNEAKNLLADAALQIRQLSDDIKSDLQDVIIVAGETGAFLIDKATENIITIASVVLLALGAIIFVWLLFRSSRGLTGFAAILAYVLVIAYIGFFGALLLVPQFRTFVISSTGIGLKERLEVVTEQPDIFTIRPTEIIVGETEEIDIWGSSLLPNGEQPTVTIGNRSFPFTATDDRIVVDVSSIIAQGDADETPIARFGRIRDVAGEMSDITISRDLLETIIDTRTPTLDDDTATIEPMPIFVDPGILQEIGIELQPDRGIIGIGIVPDIRDILSVIPEGTAVLKLDYETFEDLTALVRVTVPPPPLSPPDLQISSFTINPSSPTEDDNAQARITIRNAGEQEATNFNVVWRPNSSVQPRTQNIGSLAGGASQTFTFNFAYPSSGIFTSVAEIDTLNRVAESNEGNNSSTRSVTVQAPAPRRVEVTVQFTSVAIHDDAETGEGELVLEFNVNGATARFPNSGTKGINSNKTYSFTRTLRVTLVEGQSLNVFVNGREEDSGFNGADDAMGTVNVTYSTGQNWGAGAHSNRSTCPDGCYTIFYNISVRDLP